ncbi:Bgt-50615 [Blumeria graminis f. sp. tritici]|uniref:Bgt-50615 n=1 Tax=Blumeria graminis f. sp. tritici TaxID=62690 RepID=A0A9X9MHN8_BLUGR|nr:Bgt-50615 [Blumeria graminis f. sp. tritici]
MQITAQLGISQGQVNYSLRCGAVSPKKRKRKSSRLKADDVDQIISYFESSPGNRCKTFLELASGPFRHLGVSEQVIQRELKKTGYQRHMARLKPPVSQKTMKIRREWAEAHLNWTHEEWTPVLWTDETWVEDGRHSRDWVTRSVCTFLNKKMVI